MKEGVTLMKEEEVKEERRGSSTWRLRFQFLALELRKLAASTLAAAQGSTTHAPASSPSCHRGTFTTSGPLAPRLSIF
jgi:hypothetical protein